MRLPCDVSGNESTFALPRAVGRQPLQCGRDTDANISVVSHVRSLHPQRLDPGAGLLRTSRRFQSSISSCWERAWQVCPLLYVIFVSPLNCTYFCFSLIYAYQWRGDRWPQYLNYNCLASVHWHLSFMINSNWKRRVIRNLLRQVHKTGLLDFLQEARDHMYRAAVWYSLGQSLIDDAIDHWPAHLRACL